VERKKNLIAKADQILDESQESELEVIVQLISPHGVDRRFAIGNSASEPSRWRFCLSPRDLLPGAYIKKEKSRDLEGVASVFEHLRVTRGQEESLKIASFGKAPQYPPDSSFFKSNIVQNAVSRMMRTNVAAERSPFWFKSSRSMLLRLERSEIHKLIIDQTDKIQTIHINRKLSLPSIAQSRAPDIEENSILSSTWGLDKIKATSVWGVYGARGKGVTIALLDTGVDAKHPDLAGKIQHWAEFNSQGYLIDDNNENARDSDDHGTHCGGVLVGGRESGRFIGVAPEAQLAAAMVLNAGTGTDAQILAGIDWAINKKVDVISMSLGGLTITSETPSTYTRAILTSIEEGIPVVAAIGNSGNQTTFAPGNDYFTLSVGAVDPNDRVAGFSSGRTQFIADSVLNEYPGLPKYYFKPDLVAPGVAVYSSVPGPEKHAWFNGTSMATPHVAGAIALLLSATDIRNKTTKSERAFLISDLITGSVEEMGEFGQDHRYGYGRLDILRAIDIAIERGYGRS